jgi:hypothetical protein
MRIRNLVQSVLVLALLCSAVPAAALKHFYYAGTYAASYARNNAYMPYGSGSGKNPFYNFGDNCANFISQAIIGGMILRTTPAEVFASRADFAADQSADVRTPRWYFLDINHRGPAWSGAQQMYDYANYNQPSYKGLHFQFVGSDTPSNRSLNPLNLWPGDVIFCDWKNDGSINHVIMVSSISFSPFIWNKYDRIRVTSQSNPRVDWTLQQIIDQSHHDDGGWPSFRVYRPVDYNQAGH